MDSEYTTEDLMDGRFALKRKGIVVSVGRSHEELEEYLNKRFVSYTGEHSEISLGEAVRRIQ
jgi:hypothetical protein